MKLDTCLLILGLTVAAGCGRSESAGPVTEAPEPAPEASVAGPVATSVHVTLAPTVGHTTSGMLMLTETPAGLSIAGRIVGLGPDGAHGFHIHETGDCSAPDASSAGGHFNPTAQVHGDPRGAAHHLGDMLNLDVNPQGEAEVDVTIPDLRLTGPAESSAADRAVVVHAEPDDYTTQPSGASGDRIACGVIRVDAVTAPVVP